MRASRALAFAFLCLAFSNGAASAEAADKAAPADGKDRRLPFPQQTFTPAAEEVDPDRFGGRPPDAAYGAFQRGLYLTALNLARPRAEKGDAAAQILLAEIYSRGLGVARDLAEAGRWYEKAAAQGAPEAEFRFGMMLLTGDHVEKDEDRAYKLLQSAADAGNHLAQFNFAQLVIQRDDGEAGFRKAVPYYEKAAEGGLADAQYAMSQVYANGVGGKKQDDVEARKWLLMAARQNFDTAQLDLATWLINGRGGERDYEAGFAWMKRAAEVGNVAAQNRLAKLYSTGIGTEGNRIEAAAWYIIAKRAGLHDLEMEDFMNGLTDEEKKTALERANRLR